MDLHMFIYVIMYICVRMHAKYTAEITPKFSAQGLGGGVRGIFIELVRVWLHLLDWIRVCFRLFPLEQKELMALSLPWQKTPKNAAKNYHDHFSYFIIGISISKLYLAIQENVFKLSSGSHVGLAL